MEYLISSAVGYILGSVNFAIIVSKLRYKQDIRDFGSRNAGMTNMLRVYGWRAALPVFVGDLLKSVAAVELCQWLYPGSYATYFAAFFAVLGHLFPVYFGFRGGKGVVTTAGVMLAIDPIVLLIIIVPWFAVAFSTRIVSLASLTAAALYPIVTALVLWLRGEPVLYPALFALALSLLVITMHKDNIKRLLSGTENRFGGKK